MTVSVESQKTIDAYLAELRRQLREFMNEDANDIVEEIRAHILDKTSGASSTEKIAETLAALGTPAELAGRYRTDELFRRAQRTRSPLVSLHSLFRWATLSLTGIVVFLVSVVGYTLGGALVLFVVAKLIFPRATGLWESHNPDGTWSLGLSSSSGGTPPPGAHDLLGWWLVLIGLALGPLLIVLTFRFGSWSIRRFWRPRAWPRA
ncbi:MAG TPA: hypothetical protein VMG31_12035 [Verrucomicrobiae bacterium]|nr:hypothetical protein [Verrucomicrobiae bacterium]